MSEEQENEIYTFPIEWEVPDALVVYADNFVVQHTGSDFIISMFQIVPPIVIGTQVQQEEQLKKLGPLKAKCVARAMLSPQHMQELILILQKNYNRSVSENKKDEEEG